MNSLSVRRILVFGATSAIAEEVVRLFAAERAELFLVGRNAEKLELIAKDALARGSERVSTCIADLSKAEGQRLAVSQASAFCSCYDVVFAAHGVLPDQAQCNTSTDAFRAVFETNLFSMHAVLTPFISKMRESGAGVVAVISSVAADRGRASNYAYGASKAALDAYLSGLRNQLSSSGVSVLTIKPGFVDTPMIAHLKKSRLFASPQEVGKVIYHAILKRKDVLYVPAYWRWLMLIVRMIPEALFKKMKV